MKKGIFVCFYLIICSLLFSQEFNLQWLNNMSDYLGKEVHDIPDTYIKRPHDKSVYSRELSIGIFEGLNVSNTNLINGIFWLKRSNSRSFLYLEFVKLVNTIKNNLGEHVFKRENYFVWNWQSKPLIVLIREGEVGIMLITLDVWGFTHDQWKKIVQENS